MESSEEEIENTDYAYFLKLLIIGWNTLSITFKKGTVL